MAKIPGKLGKLGSIKGIVTLGIVIILLGLTTWGLAGGVFGGVPAQNNKGSVQLAPAVSPLLFGTNMGLFDSNDQVLTSSTTRSLLQQMHVRIIRMPVRSSLSEATEIQAAQVIKSLGAVPLVVLRGAVDSNVLADDSLIINDMNRIFGNGVVYYEYGNEEDLLGVDVNGYTASWNAVVPQLKRLAPQGQFVGPVNFQYDRTYLTTFLQNANPRPNQVSWHEYTCDDSWASSICISHIANWTNHISDARAAMQSIIGAALPIMITEWNYAPNAVPNDGKNNDSAFMSTCTIPALTTISGNISTSWTASSAPSWTARQHDFDHHPDLERGEDHRVDAANAGSERHLRFDAILGYEYRHSNDLVQRLCHGTGNNLPQPVSIHDRRWTTTHAGANDGAGTTPTHISYRQWQR